MELLSTLQEALPKLSCGSCRLERASTLPGKGIGGSGAPKLCSGDGFPKPTPKEAFASGSEMHACMQRDATEAAATEALLPC